MSQIWKIRTKEMRILSAAPQTVANMSFVCIVSWLVVSIKIGSPASKSRSEVAFCTRQAGVRNNSVLVLWLVFRCRCYCELESPKAVWI